MTRILRIGTIADGYPQAQRDIFAKVEFTDGKLSISGVIGPKGNGDAHGSCGQFIIGFKEYDHRGHHTLADVTPAPNWTAETVRQFFDAWDRWHLNDMKAGSTEQEQYLRDHPMDPASYTYPKDHYTAACAHLKAAGLNPDSDGYSYGTAWKTEAVPVDVLAFLQSLPESDKTPAWV